MDKFDRIFALHNLFAARRTPLKLLDMEKRLECSRPTVYRLIEVMRDRLGAPILKDRKSGGFLYDRNAPAGPYELPGLWFSAAELQALVVFQRLLRSLEPGLLEDQLAPLGRRLDELLAHRRLNLSGVERRIRVLGAAARPVGDAFGAVANALLQRRRLRFTYRSRSKDEITVREVSPQRLAHYRDNWYLDAWDHGRQALRSFAMERIADAAGSKETARDVTEAELDEHLGSAYGIFSGGAAQEAVLRFTAERARWVADECWHPRQTGRWLPDGCYELRIPYGDPRELVMDVLRHTPHVEVIEPDSLRTEVSGQLRRGMEVYG